MPFGGWCGGVRNVLDVVSHALRHQKSSKGLNVDQLRPDALEWKLLLNFLREVLHNSVAVPIST